MQRDEVLALYRPIRAAIQRVLKLAPSACSRADLMRAAKHLGVWHDGRILADDDTINMVTDMVTDIALFEPNRNGRRAFDVFLEGRKAERLDPGDLEVARRMAGAFFTIVRIAGRHEAAGLWLEDILDGDRRLWLMDEALETSAREGAEFGMRLFDAGPFHAGFGIVVTTDEDTIAFCIDARRRGVPSPFRHSVAATLYGDVIRARTPIGPGDEELVNMLLDLLPGGFAVPDDGETPPEPPARSPARRRRKPRSRT